MRFRAARLVRRRPARGRWRSKAARALSLAEAAQLKVAVAPRAPPRRAPEDSGERLAVPAPGCPGAEPSRAEPSRRRARRRPSRE